MNRTETILPEYERVLFRNSALELCLVQLRYPPVPRFSEEKFLLGIKEALAEEYPLISLDMDFFTGQLLFLLQNIPQKQEHSTYLTLITTMKPLPNSVSLLRQSVLNATMIFFIASSAGQLVSVNYTNTCEGNNEYI
jgi:hypothetical protein